MVPSTPSHIHANHEPKSDDNKRKYEGKKKSQLKIKYGTDILHVWW